MVRLEIKEGVEGYCREEGCTNFVYLGDLCREHVVLIKKYRIEGTDTWIYSAWVPSTLTGAHHVFTSVEGEVFGRVGTLTNTEEEYEAAYEEIIDEYPEAAAGKKDKGEIELVMTEDSDYKKDKVTEDLQKIADELGATLIKESD